MTPEDRVQRRPEHTLADRPDAGAESGEVPADRTHAALGRLSDSLRDVAAARGEFADLADALEDVHLLLPESQASLVRLLAERSAALSALRDAEEQWRLILETANDAFVGMDERGDIIDWNRRAEELFGWKAEEAIGRCLAHTIIPPHLREAHERGLALFLQTGQGSVVFRRLEVPALHRDGHQFDAEVTIWPSHNGSRYRFNAFVRDVSVRNRMAAHVELLQRVAFAANAAADVESATRAALREVGAAISWPIGHAYVTDPENTARLLPTGWWHLEHDRYRRFMEVTEALPLERGTGLPGRVLETGQPLWVSDVRRELTFTRGAVAQELGLRGGYAFPILVGEEVAGVLEFFGEEPAEPDEDLLSVMGNVGTQLGRVFEREQAARELEHANAELRSADQTKSRFVSVVSHELRSPLSAILGFAALMDATWDELEDQEKRDYVRSIERQARRLSRLVSDLLTVSRLDAKAIEPHPADLEVLQVIRQVVSDLGIAGIEVACAPDLRVHADPDHVTQMLVNYLTNAQRYGAPPIRVEAWAEDDHVDIRVCDHGQGVSEGFLPRLFQPFARARGVKSPGSGLGLSIVQGLARANDGDTWYEPLQPHGACFVVRLRRTA